MAGRRLAIGRVAWCTIEGVADAGEAGLTRRVAKLFTPYRGRLALIGTAIVVTSVLAIVNPFLTKAVFDRALFVPWRPPTCDCCSCWSGS